LRSGLVEAACKTLVAQRLKLSGVRWGFGAQAILAARGWDQSNRFDEAWALLAARCHAEVYVLAKVIPLMPPKPPRRARAGRELHPRGWTRCPTRHRDGRATQRITAARLHRMLRDEDIVAGDTVVKDVVREWKRQR
jgi:hypothetical protein